MKKIIPLILSAVLLLSAVACGASTSAWQKQYDLGVRYLSDGNYEEAIIAFTAAIEIEPKRAEAYIGAADAYIQQGNYALAKEILERGLSATNDARIESRLNEIALNEYGATKFEARSNYCEFNTLSEEDRGYILEVIAALETGNEERLISLTRLIDTRSNIGRIYSKTDKYKVDIFAGKWESDLGYQYQLCVEIREENGNAYLTQIDIATDLSSWGVSEDAIRTEYYGYYSGTCRDWQWDGEIAGVDKRLVEYNDGHSTYSIDTETAHIVCGLRDGTAIFDWVSYDYVNGVMGDPSISNETIEYKDGIQISREWRFKYRNDDEWDVSTEVYNWEGMVESVQEGHLFDLAEATQREHIYW